MGYGKSLKAPPDMGKLLIRIKTKLRYNQRKDWDEIAYTFLKAYNPILDAGCGIGRFIEQNPQSIIGIDWNPESVKICRSKGYNVIQADIRALPFEGGSISGIYCSHIIEHFMPSDVHKILSEFDRVLMPQGIMVIRAPLLWRGFYSDLTHIRPYNPDVIIRYFTPWEQHTLEQISTDYEVLSLKWRYDPIRTGIRLCNFAFNSLNRWGFPWLKKTGYMLVLKKKR